MNIRQWTATAGHQIDRLLTIFVAAVLCVVGAVALGGMPNASAHETDADSTDIDAAMFYVPAVESVLNVRAEPGGDVVWEIGPSNIVRATGETDAVGDRLWTKVVISNDRSGWVVTDLLRSATHVPEATPPLNWQTLEAQADVRIRNTPAGTPVRLAIEGSLIQATVNRVEAAGTEWTEVELDSGLRGWIASYLLAESDTDRGSQAQARIADLVPEAALQPTVAIPTAEPATQHAAPKPTTETPKSDVDIAAPTVTSTRRPISTPTPRVSTNGDSPTSPAMSPSCREGYYRNVDNNCIQRPSSNPTGASAKCNDGTYSYSQNRRGTCSHHGGVATWLR